MRTLSTAQLLDFWEKGRSASAAERALMLLIAAEPERTPAQIGAASIGQRDADLLELRARTFGSRLAALASCPRCTEQLELNFAVADIQSPPSVAGGDGPERGDGPEMIGEQSAMMLEAGGYQLRFRLPNSLDLVAVGREVDTAVGARLLLQRCIVAAQRGDETFAPEEIAQELPEDVVVAIGNRMAEADPQATIELDLACPACGALWLAPFDIVAFFWTEIDAWAQRVLLEVHLLASAYGWSEREILALSPERRQIYLELIAA